MVVPNLECRMVRAHRRHENSSEADSALAAEADLDVFRWAMLIFGLSDPDGAAGNAGRPRRDYRGSCPYPRLRR